MSSKLVKLGALIAAIYTSVIAEEAAAQVDAATQDDGVQVEVEPEKTPEEIAAEKQTAEFQEALQKARQEVRDQTTLITADMDIPEILAKHDFTFVSFYKPSDSGSLELQDLFDDAQFYMNNKMRVGDWAKRDVGWYRIDMDATPELVFYEEKNRPDQVVFGPGVHRFIHWLAVSQEWEEAVHTYAQAVRELTGDFVKKIKCADIQKPGRDTLKDGFWNEIIYFGDKADLAPGGSAHVVSQASMFDRYQFDEDRAGFYYVEERECRRSKGAANSDNKQVGFFNGEGALPYFLVFGDDEIPYERMLYETTASIARGTPKWGQRAKVATE